MEKFGVNEIRNVGIFGHGGDGKTSLVEAILFDTGVNNRLGSVDEGTSLMDYDQEEVNRKITINSSFAYAEWNNHKLNLIDTPGYANFIADDSFVVDATAIPEFPAVITAIVVAGLCFGIYWWMRKRVHGVCGVKP